MHSSEERKICCRLRTQGFTLGAIAKALDVCKRSVQRWLNGDRLVERPLNRKHLRKLNLSQCEQLVEFFLSTNTNTLAEGAAFVRNTFQVSISVSTIQRILHMHQLTFKKGSCAFQEASAAKQSQFLCSLQAYKDKKWVAMDEAAFFLRHSRKYAWSRRGQRAVIVRPGQRGQMHSLLLAMSPSGVIDWQLYQGSVNSIRFHSFLSSLPDNTNIVLDNVATHKAKRTLHAQQMTTIEQVASSKSQNMLYLPPYSPQLNPVELCFNAIRTTVNKIAPRTNESLSRSLQQAISRLTSDICAKMFMHTLGISANER